ncbi:MAG: lipopolysaccharide export system permease protein [Myxococcota bacterium]|jgi:lipopolysaccharide export system permease protein
MSGSVSSPVPVKIFNARLPVLRTLSRYFAARYLSLFAFILVITTLTIVVIEMLLNLDDMLSADHGAAAPLKYLLLRIPSYYLRELIPIASFAAAFFTLGLSTHWYEVSAAKAGGISPDRLVASVLLAATAVALLSVLLSEGWIVGATREWNRFESGAGPQISYREGAFWYQHGQTIYNISEADPSQRTLRGVQLFNLDSRGHLLRSVVAKQVDVRDDNRWLFRNATVQHFEPGNPEAGIRIEQLDEIILDVADPRDQALINTDFQSLGIATLRDYVATRNAAGESANRAATVLCSRIVEPLSVVLFALLAAPLGLRVNSRRSFGLPALIGIGVVSVFIAVRSVGMTLSNEGVVAAHVASAALVFVFAVTGVVQMRFIER